MIYLNSVADKLLACYVKKPSLCLNEKYKIDQSEFKVQFHKVIYVVCYNLACDGYNSISLMDINNWLEPYKTQYEIYKSNSGDDYINTITELVDEENFEAYYKEFRRFSVLNVYKEKNFDISQFYDETKSEESQLENLNKYKIEDIINYFDGVQVDIRKSFYPRDKNIEETKLGYGIDEFIQQVQEEPLYGVSFNSELLNTVTRGMVDGQLSCFSSPTGVGKTTVAIATMCNICATEIWDYDKKCFVKNQKKTRNGGLYIQFELANVEEVSIKFLASISGVPTDVILDGKFTDEQLERIKKARQIQDESNIYIVYMPNFTKYSIDEMIKDYVLNHNIDLVVYDYIQEGAELNAEMNRDNGGVGLRTDQVLANLSDFLKSEARKYNVPIYTMTQCNANLATSEILGAECIAGSRAVANKLDVGGILLPLRPKEVKALEIIEQGLKQRGFGNNPHANYCYHMFKVRFGKYPQNIKIWVDLDLGTGRMRDCFCTDWQNNIIDVHRTKLNGKEDE